MTKIAITGATGTVGRCLLNLFEERGIAVRPLVRGKERVHPWQHSTPHPFDYDDSSTHEKALEGIEKLLLIADSTDEGVAHFLKKAQEQRLAHVVFLSGISAERYPEMPLAKVERLLYSTQLPFTCLRLNWFMQNFSGLFAPEIAREGRLTLPAGEAKSSFIDARDIAEVAAAILLDETGRYINKAFPLTGAEALDHAAVVAMIGAACGKAIRYEPLSREEGYFKFIDMGWDKESAAIMVELYEGVKKGATEKSSPWVENILQKPPRSFAAFVEENKNCWLA